MEKSKVSIYSLLDRELCKHLKEVDYHDGLGTYP